MTKRKTSKKQTQTRRSNSADEQLIRIAYAGILITLAVIALLGNATRPLGVWLQGLSKLLVGNITWIFFYLGLAFYGVCLLTNKPLWKKKYSLIVGLVILFVMMVCAIQKDMKGFETLKDYTSNLKSVISLDANARGGIFGALIFSCISALGGFWAYIVALVVLAVFIVYLAVKENKIPLPKVTGKLEENPKKVIKKATIKVAKDTQNKFFLNPVNRKNKLFKKDKVVKHESPIVDVNTEKARQKSTYNYVQEPKKVITTETKPSERKPVMVEHVKKQEPAKVETPSTVSTIKTDNKISTYANYKKPSFNLLENYVTPRKNANRNSADQRGAELVEILDNFGLPSSIAQYNIGPSVTQFEIVPEGNFNIKKYSTIEENIKMQLAVKDIRIEAPIPGKRAVGIEIPNVERTSVRLKELLNSMPSEYTNKPLTMALGKDLTGQGVYGQIDKMPHLLIAGTTGSGKSVCINSIILTILLRATPDEVGLLMVDPKKVEFTPYEQIPHLVCPIINDTTKAAGALGNLVKLMDQRYEKFSQNGVRNIGEYNKKFPEKKMKNIVCIIDEMADLMMTHRKEVETHIARLAAMARASGIFMILATQRPSTDVITGTIKNNIASRIAFAVGSSYDSRTIIDRTGAEALFGNGDMLYMPVGANAPVRVQGVYVSDDEINSICQYFKDRNFLPKYEDIFIIDEEAEDSLSGEKCTDPMYEEIKKFVYTQQTISASMLQRKCGLGFPRAAKIIDALEADGIISGLNGSKPRTVLVHPGGE